MPPLPFQALSQRQNSLSCPAFLTPARDKQATPTWMPRLGWQGVQQCPLRSPGPGLTSKACHGLDFRCWQDPSCCGRCRVLPRPTPRPRHSSASRSTAIASSQMRTPLGVTFSGQELPCPKSCFLTQRRWPMCPVTGKWPPPVFVQVTSERPSQFLSSSLCCKPSLFTGVAPNAHPSIPWQVNPRIPGSLPILAS